MTPEQAKAIGADLAAAVGSVLLKHGINGGPHVAKISSNELIFKINISPAGPTPNAVSRYKQFASKLGLPKIGAIMLVAGKEYALVGLSSDGARVKAIQTMPGAKLVDLPLASVTAAIAATGAKEVAQLDKAEAAAADDIDPSIASLLGDIAKAKKPAEGSE